MSPSHGGNLSWAASLAGCSPSHLLDFSASINPMGPPEAVLVAIQTSLQQLLSYPNPDYSQLCDAIADYHGLSPQWVLPGNGSAELLTWAGRELAALPQTHLFTPAFGDYFRAIRAFEGQIVTHPLTPPFLQIPQLPNGSGQSGLLINNPHNPTGLLRTRDELLPYLNQFALVVVDEAFMDFLPPEEQQSLIDSIEQYPNLVILRSFTKFYSLPGLRIGYAIAHPDRLRLWRTWRDPWPVNQLAVVAAIAALQAKEFQAKTWIWLNNTRCQLWQSLNDIPHFTPYPSSANYILVNSHFSVSQLQLRLLKHHQILIRDCISFPELGDHFFRIAVRTLEDNQRLINAILG